MYIQPKKLGLIFTIAVMLAVTFAFMTAKANNYEVSNKPIVVGFDNLTTEAQRQVKCLADNIFFESAYEPIQGQIGVAMVTLNRVGHPEFESSICGVVKERQRNVCQFSWYCEDRQRERSITILSSDNQVYRKILELAVYVYVNHEHIVDPTNGALFYHADYVRPNWRGVVKTTQIGRHIFYIHPKLQGV